MKQSILILSALSLALACTSPAVEVTPEPEPTVEPLPGFVAVMEQPFVAPCDATVPADTVLLQWGKRCNVSINGNEYYYSESGGGPQTRFVTSGDDVAPRKTSPKFTAFYPVTCEEYLSGLQPRFPGEIPVFPLYAADDGDTLHFRHLAGALVLSLSSSDGALALKKIEIGADSPLCGSFVLSDGVPQMTAPFGSIVCESSFTLSAEESLFWFVLPEGDYPNLKITLTDSAGADVSYDSGEVRLRRGYSSFVRLSPRPRDFIPANTILYTTTDGGTIKPYNLTPDSNVYSDGKGRMVFPRNLTTITSNAFDNTDGYCPDGERLTSIQLPRDINALGNYLFRNCVNLTELEFPAGGNFTSVSASICYGCTSLERVVMPSSVVKINNNAFQNCSALENVVLSANLKNIPQNTFNGCSSLKVLDIPDSVNTIGVKAFMGTALETLVLPAGVTALSTQLFQDCKSLESVTLLSPDSPVTFAANAFKNCIALKYIYVPAALVDAYKADDSWKTYWNLITPLPQ